LYRLSCSVQSRHAVRRSNSKRSLLSMPRACRAGYELFMPTSPSTRASSTISASKAYTKNANSYTINVRIDQGGILIPLRRLAGT
jgi:hypothetical protein